MINSYNYRGIGILIVIINYQIIGNRRLMKKTSNQNHWSQDDYTFDDD